jgi:hypothetical protein
LKAAAVIALALGFGACTPPKPEVAPPQAMAETFAGCVWGEVVGAGLSVWSYRCGRRYGHARLVADESLPGFVIESRGPDGETLRQVAIRVFDKPNGAPIEAVLPEVREASPGYASDTCAFELTDLKDDRQTRYVLAPTGDARLFWEEALQHEMPPPPCGELGMTGVGDRTFEILEGAPGKVAFIEWGSEIQIFDGSTLKAR